MALQLYCKCGGAHAKRTKQWVDASLVASDSVEMGEPCLFKSWKRFCEQIKGSVVFQVTWLEDIICFAEGDYVPEYKAQQPDREYESSC